MKSIKVLIVDDHKLIREGMGELLKGEPDIEVVGEAVNGIDSVEKTALLSPNIVLMDINMPELNGIEATRQIKAKFPEVQVIALTMYDYEEYVMEILQAGALGYVLKKGGKQDVISAIRTVHEGGTFLFPSIASKVVQRATQASMNTGTDLQPILTGREKEILTYVAKGCANQEIASALALSIRTVETHRANIMKKLGCHNTADLVRYALARGLGQTTPN